MDSDNDVSQKTGSTHSMSYKHLGMPPVIRRTAHDHYQLESQDGTVVAEYNQAELSHPGDWWSDLVDAISANYTDPVDAIHDVTLLSAANDWQYIDDRTDS